MNKNGFAFIAAIIILVLLAALGTFSMSMLSTDINIATDTEKSTQAFYIAEAGIQHVVYKLKNDSDYRDDPSAVTTGNLGEGSYSVSVTVDGDDYTLTSIGTRDNVQRVIVHAVTVEEAGDTDFLNYAIFLGGGDGTIWTSILKNANITGSIFINGDMDIGKDSNIDGDVVATGEIGLGSDVTITGDTLPDSDPPAQQPSFVTTYYDDLISTATSQPSGDQNISGEISGTTYVNGLVTVNGNLTGSGIIVTSGDVDINRGITIGDNITLISGDTFTVKKDVTIGDNCTLYASNQLTINKNNNTGSSDNGSALLSGGDVDIAKDSTIYGFIYGDAEVNIDKNFTFVGNLCGSEMGEIQKDCNITFNNELIDFSSIQGFASGVTVTLGDWDEAY